MKRNQKSKILIATSLVVSTLASTGLAVGFSQVNKNNTNQIVLNENTSNVVINSSPLAVTKENFNNIKNLNSFSNTNWENMSDVITTDFLKSNDNSGLVEEVYRSHQGNAGAGYSDITCSSGNINMNFNLPFFNVNQNFNNNLFFNLNYFISMTSSLKVDMNIGLMTQSSGWKSMTINNDNKQSLTSIFNSDKLSANIAQENMWIDVGQMKFEIKKVNADKSKININSSASIIVKSNGSMNSTYRAKIDNYKLDLKLKYANLTKMYSYMINNYLMNNLISFNDSDIKKTDQEKLNLLNQTIKNYLTSNFDKDVNNNPSNPYDKIYEPSDFKTSVDLKKVIINNEEKSIPTFSFTFRDFLDKEVNGSYQPNYVTISYPIQTNLWNKISDVGNNGESDNITNPPINTIPPVDNASDNISNTDIPKEKNPVNNKQNDNLPLIITLSIILPLVAIAIVILTVYLVKKYKKTNR